jgi:hypothetical protein
VAGKVPPVEDKPPKVILPFEARHRRLRRETRGDDELPGDDPRLDTVGPRYSQQPAAVRAIPVLGDNDLRAQPDKRRDAEACRICVEVVVDNSAGDMLARTDSEDGWVHGEIRVLICAE